MGKHCLCHVHVRVTLTKGSVIIIIISYYHRNTETLGLWVQCNMPIQNYRDAGLPEKQVLIKLAAHYNIYMHC